MTGQIGNPEGVRGGGTGGRCGAVPRVTAAPLVTDQTERQRGEVPLVVVLGPPGSGKGTQCERMASALGLAHVSTGHALREQVRLGTRLGIEASRYMEHGQLVPDDLVVEAVTESLEQCGARAGVMLDGFPRTASQALLLDELGIGTVRLAAALVVPRTALLERLRARGRTDDHIDVVRKRLLTYETETRPLLDHYGRRGILVLVDGHRGPAEVSAALRTHFVAAGVASGGAHSLSAPFPTLRG